MLTTELWKIWQCLQIKESYELGVFLNTTPEEDYYYSFFTVCVTHRLSKADEEAAIRSNSLSEKKLKHGNVPSCSNYCYLKL